MGERTQPDGSSLTGDAVELPLLNKQRYFVFRGRNGTYTLVDDFLYSSDAEIMRVEEKGGEFIYSTLDGTKVLTRPSDKAAAPANVLPPPAAAP